MKLLMIEDEKELRDVVVKYLEKQKYNIEIASNYHSGLNKIIDFDYDCILIDLMLPDRNGMDLLKEIKKNKKKATLIIISAKDSVDDKVQGLDLGADDYLTKPFHLAELHARIKSAMRRKNHDGDQIILWNNLILSPEQRTVVVNNKNLTLNRKEFDLLYYFIINPNRLISKTSLVEYVWGDYADQSNSLDFIYSQIKNLRKKLKEVGADFNIQTIYGMGYKIS